VTTEFVRKLLGADKAWTFEDFCSAAPLTEIIADGVVHKVGTLSAAQLFLLAGIYARIADGTATKEDRWPYREVFFLLNAANPGINARAFRGITPDHIKAATLEVLRQYVMYSISADHMAGTA
jgi:hypothetical protein